METASHLADKLGRPIELLPWAHEAEFYGCTVPRLCAMGKTDHLPKRDIPITRCMRPCAPGVTEEKSFARGRLGLLQKNFGNFKKPIDKLKIG